MDGLEILAWSVFVVLFFLVLSLSFRSANKVKKKEITGSWLGSYALLFNSFLWDVGTSEQKNIFINKLFIAIFSILAITLSGFFFVVVLILLVINVEFIEKKKNDTLPLL